MPVTHWLDLGTLGVFLKKKMANNDALVIVFFTLFLTLVLALGMLLVCMNSPEDNLEDYIADNDEFTEVDDGDEFEERGEELDSYA